MSGYLTYWCCPLDGARFLVDPHSHPIVDAISRFLDFEPTMTDLQYTGIWEMAEAKVEQHECDAHGIQEVA